MNTVGLRVPTKHIRYFSTFIANDVSRQPHINNVGNTKKITYYSLGLFYETEYVKIIHV
jgi:hypothetical protein